MPTIQKTVVVNEGRKKPRTPNRTVRTLIGIEFVTVSEKIPKREPRHREPANMFKTWGGRRKRPSWLRAYLEQGAQLPDFEV